MTATWRACAMGLGLAMLAGCPGDPQETVTAPTSEVQSEVPRPFPHVLPTAPEPLGEPRYAPWTSGRALAVHGAELYALDAANGALAVIDTDSFAVTRTVPIGERPSQLVVGPDGVVYAAVGHTGELVRIEPGAAAVSARIVLGERATALALSQDADTVYVALPDQRRVAIVDAASLTEQASIDVEQAPRALAYVADDGFGELTVVHQHGRVLRVPLVGDREPVDPQPLSLRVGSPTDRMLFSSRTSQLMATRAWSAAVHPVTGTVFAVHTQVTPGRTEDLQAMALGLERDPSAPPPPPAYYGPADPPETYGTPTRPVEVMVSAWSARGDRTAVGVGASRLPVQDPWSGEPMTHLVSDPSDLIHHPSWSLLLVAGLGSDNVLVLNTRHPEDPMLSPLAVIDVGPAPAALALSDDGRFAYALGAHDLSVVEIDLQPLWSQPRAEPERPVGIRADGSQTVLGDAYGTVAQVAPLRLSAGRRVIIGVDPLPAALQRGRRLYTWARNPRLSRAGHFSCNTCHPDGGEDKLVWVVTQGPRQTPALAGRLEGTAPYNWNGTRHDLVSNMQRTVGRMGGSGLRADELSDLERFLREGLEPVKNPLEGQELSYQAWWGKQLFEDPTIGCAGCHAGPQLSGGNYDVGTLGALEQQVFEVLAGRGEAEVDDPRLFNAPSLRGVFATAPYLHDGSAATLRDVLDRTSGRMGNTAHLSPEEKDAIVAYLETL